MTTTAIISIEQATKNGNSIENQQIKSKFIGIHVHSQVNSIVEFILKSEDYDNAPFSYDDIENYYSYPELGEFEGGSEDDREKYIKETEWQIDTLQDELSDIDDKMLDIEDSDLNESESDKYLSLQKEHEAKETEIENAETHKDEVEGLDSEPQEVYEWWMVSNYLLSKLKAYGHPTISSENIWGRGTSGQAILLDHVITKICADMEILHGQSNSWAK